MLEYTKTEEIKAKKVDDSTWEVLMTATFVKKTDDGERKETYTVKSLDTDMDRALTILSKAVISYFNSISYKFEDGYTDAQNKGNEVSLA